MINKGHLNNFRIWLTNTDLHILEALQDKVNDILTDEFDNTTERTSEYKEMEEIADMYADKVMRLLKNKW